MRYTIIGSDSPAAREVSVLNLGAMRFGTTTDETTSFAILDREASERSRERLGVALGARGPTCCNTTTRICACALTSPISVSPSRGTARSASRTGRSLATCARCRGRRSWRIQPIALVVPQRVPCQAGPLGHLGDRQSIGCHAPSLTLRVCSKSSSFVGRRVRCWCWRAGLLPGTIGHMTDRVMVRQWLAAYEAAWRTPGTDGLAGIFTEGAAYRQAPYQEPVVGLAAIRRMWDEEREGPDEVFTIATDILAVDGRTAVVRAEVRYGNPVRQEYRDLWIMHLDEDGRCRSFEEWPYWPGQPGAAQE